MASSVARTHMGLSFTDARAVLHVFRAAAPACAHRNCAWSACWRLANPD